MRTRRLAKIARALLAGVLIAPIISVFMPTQSAVAASGDGLQFYWKNETGASKDLTASAFYTGTCATAVAGINFSWVGGSPAGCNTDGFTTYGIGYLLAPTTGAVTFCVQSDDGFILKINGTEVIGNWVDQGAATGTNCNATANYQMDAGVNYLIQVWHHENGGGADLRLRWSYSGQSSIIIPTGYFSGGTTNFGSSISFASCTQDSSNTSGSPVGQDMAKGCDGNTATVALSYNGATDMRIDLGASYNLSSIWFIGGADDITYRVRMIANAYLYGCATNSTAKASCTNLGTYNWNKDTLDTLGNTSPYPQKSISAASAYRYLYLSTQSYGIANGSGTAGCGVSFPNCTQFSEVRINGSVSSQTLATPSAPTVSATSNTLKSIDVSWSAISNASSYTLKIYNASESLLLSLALPSLSGTSKTITTSDYASLANSTAYKISVTAIGNNVEYLTSSESTKSDVTTNAAPGSPTITSQPTAQISTFGSTATFSVSATSPDSGSLGYQWQVNTGSTWANLAAGSGFTTNSYTTLSLVMAASGYQYRVNVTNTKNGATSTAVTSNAVGLTVNKATQAALSFTLNTSTKTSPYSQAITMTPSGGTGDGAITYAIVAGGSATSCALANNTDSNTITATTSGTCLIQATKAADTNYLVATSSNVTFTFSKADQVTLSAPILSATSKTFPYSQSPLTVTSATGGSGTGGLSITSVANGTATGCAWDGTTLSATTSGTCTLTITRAGDDNFNAATSTATFTFSKATQSALTITTTSVNFGATLTLNTSGGLGDGEVTFAVNSGNCSVSGNTLSNTSAGSCSVTATKAATTGYESISSSATTITVSQIAQSTLSFTLNTSTKSSPYSQAITMTPSGGTGDGAITYAIVAGGSATSCALANNTATNTITATTSGTCLIQATKAADTNYLAATSSNVTFTFSKATQSALTITSTSGTYNATLTLTTSGGSSGGAVTFVVDSGNCSVSSNTLSNTSAGDCYVTATMAESVGFLVVSSTSTKITIAKANQSALSVTVSGFMRGETTSISASGGSTSEAISYSVSSGSCTLSGTTVSSTGTGNCVLVATRPGNSNYELVTGSKSITVSPSNKAGLTSLTITPGTVIFTSASSTYAISVSNTVTTISFTPTFTSPFASATFGGAALTNGVAKTFTPTNGTNAPFNLVVTADDGITTRTYIIKVTKVVTTTTTISPKPTPAPTPTPTPTPAPTKSTTQPAKVPAVSLAPRITSLSNSSGAALTNVTITGSNLTGATVRLNGKSAVIVSNNGTQLVFRIPAAASSGVITILTSKGSASSPRFTVTS